MHRQFAAIMFSYIQLGGYCTLGLAVGGCGTHAQPQQRRDAQVDDTRQPGLPAAVDAPVAATPTLPALPRLIISEVLVDPLLRDEGVGDYIEVVNLAPSRVFLADLALLLPNGKRVALLRTSRPWLEPAEVAVAQGLSGDNRILVKGLRLPNAAGRIELLWRGRSVDVATWLRKRPWPKVKPGTAWERRSPNLDGTLPLAWRAATGAVDRLERGSPGKVNWPCKELRGTPLEQPCPVAQRHACRG